MPPYSDFYKEVPNRAEIEALLEPYDLIECMSDLDFFPEFVQDLIDDHPHIQNLNTVLERMLRYALLEGGFGL